jgi:hypothetical protein
LKDISDRTGWRFFREKLPCPVMPRKVKDTMCTSDGSVEPASAATKHVAHLLWRRLSPLVILVLPLFAVAAGLAACTGSAASLETPPAFSLNTQTGPASVSIRQPLPGMTDSESQQVVETAMLRAEPEILQLAPIGTAIPQRRIVWHVDPVFPYGTSRLVLNVFDGATPVWYEQEIIANSAPRAAIVGTIESMTRRLAAVKDNRSQNFASAGAMSPKGGNSLPHA